MKILFHKSVSAIERRVIRYELAHPELSRREVLRKLGIVQLTSRAKTGRWQKYRKPATR